MQKLFIFFLNLGRGGTSIYGRQFEDEISDELHHVGAGIVSLFHSFQMNFLQYLHRFQWPIPAQTQMVHSSF